MNHALQGRGRAVLVGDVGSGALELTISRDQHLASHLKLLLVAPNMWEHAYQVQ